MDIAVLVDHRVKIKEIEKIYKYLDIARELMNMWVTVIPSTKTWKKDSPVGLRLQNTTTASLQRSKTPPTSVLYMTLNNLMARLQ